MERGMLALMALAALAALAASACAHDPLFATERVLASPGVGDVQAVTAADVDGDGIFDVVYACGSSCGGNGTSTLRWSRMTGFWSSSWSTTDIATVSPPVAWIRAGDFDSDGVLDVLYSGSGYGGALTAGMVSHTMMGPNGWNSSSVASSLGSVAHLAFAAHPAAGFMAVDPNGVGVRLAWSNTSSAWIEDPVFAPPPPPVVNGTVVPLPPVVASAVALGVFSTNGSNTNATVAPTDVDVVAAFADRIGVYFASGQNATFAPNATAGSTVTGLAFGHVATSHADGNSGAVDLLAAGPFGVLVLVYEPDWRLPPVLSVSNTSCVTTTVNATASTNATVACGNTTCPSTSFCVNNTCVVNATLVTNCTTTTLLLNNTFRPLEVLITSLPTAALLVHDLDGSGTVDVVGFGGGAVYWLENTVANVTRNVTVHHSNSTVLNTTALVHDLVPVFVNHTISASNYAAVVLADVDGLGAADVVAAGGSGLAGSWWASIDPSPAASAVINGPPTSGAIPSSVVLAVRLRSATGANISTIPGVVYSHVLGGSYSGGVAGVVAGSVAPTIEPGTARVAYAGMGELVLYAMAVTMDGASVASAPVALDRVLSTNTSSTVGAAAVGGVSSISVFASGVDGRFISGVTNGELAAHMQITLAVGGSTTPLPNTVNGAALSVSALVDTPEAKVYTIRPIVDGVETGLEVLDLAPHAALSSIREVTDGRIDASVGAPLLLTLDIRGINNDTIPHVVSSNATIDVTAAVFIGFRTVPITIVASSLVSAELSTLSAEVGAFSLDVKINGEHVGNSPAQIAFFINCPPGTRVDRSACADCEAASYSDRTNVDQCTACPSGMVSPVRSTTFVNCSCSSGSWLGHGERSPNKTCVACPTGGVCLGGYSTPFAAPGYFEVAPGSSRFVACTRKGCIGSSRCGSGYKGYVCRECASGYFSRNEEECAKCPETASLRLVLAFVVILVLASLTATAMLHSIARVATLVAHAPTPQDALIAFRSRSMPVSVSIVVVACEIVALFGRANFAWSDTSKAALAVFEAFVMDAQFVGAECALPSFHVTYFVSLTALLLLLFLVIPVAMLIRTIALAMGKWEVLRTVPVRVLADTVIFSLGPIMYLPISLVAFQVFDCTRQADGKLVLDVDNGVECLDSAWWGILPFGLVVIGGFVVGLPLYFAYILRTNYHTLFQVDTTIRYGTLYRNWRHRFYWAEFASLAKRLALSITATFFSRRQVVQIWLYMSILVGTIVLFLMYSPYFVAAYNGMETRVTLCTLAVLVAGAGTYADQTVTSTKTALSAITVLAVTVFAIVSLHALATDFYSVWQERQDTRTTASARQRALVSTVAGELKDVEGGPELLKAAAEFLANLDYTIRAEARERATSILLDDLDDAGRDKISRRLEGGLDWSNVDGDIALPDNAPALGLDTLPEVDIHQWNDVPDVLDSSSDL